MGTSIRLNKIILDLEQFIDEASMREQAYINITKAIRLLELCDDYLQEGDDD